jgi:hypothetical protein
MPYQFGYMALDEFKKILADRFPHIQRTLHAFKKWKLWDVGFYRKGESAMRGKRSNWKSDRGLSNRYPNEGIQGVRMDDDGL